MTVLSVKSTKNHADILVLHNKCQLAFICLTTSSLKDNFLLQVLCARSTQQQQMGMNIQLSGCYCHTSGNKLRPNSINVQQSVGRLQNDWLHMQKNQKM